MASSNRIIKHNIIITLSTSIYHGTTIWPDGKQFIVINYNNNLFNAL